MHHWVGSTELGDSSLGEIKGENDSSLGEIKGVHQNSQAHIEYDIGHFEFSSQCGFLFIHITGKHAV